jgi:hypothetical protein
MPGNKLLFFSTRFSNKKHSFAMNALFRGAAALAKGAMPAVKQAATQAARLAGKNTAKGVARNLFKDTLKGRLSRDVLKKGVTALAGGGGRVSQFAGRQARNQIAKGITKAVTGKADKLFNAANIALTRAPDLADISHAARRIATDKNVLKRVNQVGTGLTLGGTAAGAIAGAVMNSKKKKRQQQEEDAGTVTAAMRGMRRRGKGKRGGRVAKRSRRSYRSRK